MLAEIVRKFATRIQKPMPVVVRGLAMLAAGFIALPAVAQDFPSRPITLIYPYAPGSVTETSWRFIAEEAGKIIGQPIVFENKPGAGGRLGADAVIQSDNDGYTIGVVNNGIAVVQPLGNKDIKMAVGEQYRPVIAAFETYILIAGRADLPFKDVSGMLAYARENPGKLSVGVAGMGTGGHLALEQLKHMADVDMATISYGGQAPAVTDLLGKHIDAVMSDVSAKPHIDSGNMLGLGVTGPKRWDVFPDTQTVEEAGVPGFAAATWMGLIVPAGTSDEIVAKLNGAFEQAIESDAVKEKLASGGLNALGGSPEVFGNIIQQETDTLKPLFDEGIIKLN